MIVLDTDVVIDYLRGTRQAARFLEERTEPLAVSVVTIAELYSGVRGDDEEAAVETLLSAFHVFEIDRRVAQQAGKFRQQYLRSHGVEIPDALIAATCVVHHTELATLNRRHYPMISHLLVPYRK